MFFSVVFAILAIATPLVIKSIVDSFTSYENFNYNLIVLLIIFFLMQGLFNGFSIYILSLLCETMIYRLRLQLWNKLLTMPLTFFDSSKPGELVSRLIGDIEEINIFLTEEVPKLITNIVLILGSLIALSIISFQMVVFIIIALVIFIGFIGPFSKKMQSISFEFREKVAQISSYFLRTLENIEVVKVYRTESKEVENGEKALSSIFKVGMKEAKVYAFLEPIVMILSIMLLSSILGYGSILISRGELTFGGFLAAFLILFQLFGPIRDFSGTWISYRVATGASIYVASIFSFKDKKIQKIASPYDDRDGIHVINAGFAYDDNPVLENINLDFNFGEVIAIVGPSGGGKSTLLKLLLGLYLPDYGSINYKGENVAASELYKNDISYIPQNDMLFDFNVKYNVFYGDNKNTSFIFSELLNNNFLNFNYSSLKDKFTSTLSGGQKQRVSILRALSKERNIIFLDEPTSNLDSESEAILQKHLHESHKDKIIVIVAHRLSTIINADRIIFLDNGRITGENSHEELYNNHEKYRRYVDFQVLQ